MFSIGFSGAPAGVGEFKISTNVLEKISLIESDLNVRGFRV